MADGIDKLPSGKWRARYVGPNGKRYTRTFSHKLDATHWRAQELRSIDQGAWTPPSARRARHQAQGLTVHAYTLECITARATRSRKPLAATTVDNYRKLARLTLDGTALGATPLAQVARADVARWRSELPPTSQSGKAYELLVSVFNDAVRAELVAVNPCTLQGAGTPERARSPEALSPAEIERLLDALPQQWRLPVLITATCGLRIGETLALAVRDVDVEQGTVTVRQAVAKLDNGDGTWRLELKAPKTPAARRTVALLPHTLPVIAAYLADHSHRSKPNALLFHDGHGGLLHHGRIYRAFKRAAAAIERPGLKLHDLRSTALTLAAQSGATIAELQAMAGHTTATVALSYQVPTAERDKARAQRVSNDWLKASVLGAPSHRVSHPLHGRQP